MYIYIYILIYFNLLMLVLEHNALYVAFQKDPENGYHWNDLSGHLYAYSRHEVVCLTCFQVNNLVHRS